MVYDVKRYKFESIIEQEDRDEHAWNEPNDNRHRQYTSNGLDNRECNNSKNQKQATAEEIAEAKIDGICPRCNKMIFVDPEGVYCPCGFSY